MNNSTTLSEMVASAPIVRDGSGQDTGRRCSIEHAVIRRNFNEWRDVPKEDQIAHSCVGGLPDVIPLATDGVRFIGRIPQRADEFYIGHVTNLIDPEKVKEAAKPKAAEIKNKHKAATIKTVVIALDDLFE